MDKLYPGNSKVDGVAYDVSDKPNEERRPFMALLDIGLVRTTVGNRVFGVLKGATDGGLYVPHNTKRFPGYTKDEDKEDYNAVAHRDRIFGKHVDNYMKLLSKDGVERNQKQFGLWNETLKKVWHIITHICQAGVKTVEDLYKKVHDEIRKSSERVTVKHAKAPKRDT